jgi:hypothetical protein
MALSVLEDADHWDSSVGLASNTQYCSPSATELGPPAAFGFGNIPTSGHQLLAKSHHEGIQLFHPPRETAQAISLQHLPLDSDGSTHTNRFRRLK